MGNWPLWSALPAPPLPEGCRFCAQPGHLLLSFSRQPKKKIHLAQSGAQLTQPALWHETMKPQLFRLYCGTATMNEEGAQGLMKPQQPAPGFNGRRRGVPLQLGQEERRLRSALGSGLFLKNNSGTFQKIEDTVTTRCCHVHLGLLSEAGLWLVTWPLKHDFRCFPPWGRISRP